MNTMPENVIYDKLGQLITPQKIDPAASVGFHELTCKTEHKRVIAEERARTLDEMFRTAAAAGAERYYLTSNRKEV